MHCCFSSAKLLRECATVLRCQRNVAFLVQSAIVSRYCCNINSSILFVGLVELRRYLEFKSLVSVCVVRADCTFELDRVQYRDTEITFPYSINCYQGIYRLGYYVVVVVVVVVQLSVLFVLRN